MSGRTNSAFAGYGLAIVVTAIDLPLRRALHRLVKDAAHLLVFHFFDPLLSDLGVDLMRELRARGCNIPGIALSGYGQEQDIRGSHGAGFAAHRIKPASPDRLAEMTLVVTVHREVIYGRTDSARGP